MNRYLIVALLVIVAAVALYALYGTEQTASLSDFKKELNNSSNISIIMDTRNSHSANPVLDCGSAIAGSLGYINPNNIVFEDDTCTFSLGYGDTRNISISELSNRHKDTQNSSLDDCESKFSNTLTFYIKYNSARNATSFYKSKAVIEGDGDFLNNCQLASMIGG